MGKEDIINQLIKITCTCEKHIYTIRVPDPQVIAGIIKVCPNCNQVFSIGTKIFIERLTDRAKKS